MRYSLRRALSLDSVAGGTHNPKGGGSNPAPATNPFIRIQTTYSFLEGKRAFRDPGVTAAFFHFASLRTGPKYDPYYLAVGCQFRFHHVVPIDVHRDFCMSERAFTLAWRCGSPPCHAR